MYYRVVEKIYEDGHSRFYPQKRRFIFWYSFREYYYEDYEKVSCSSLEEAHMCIDGDIASRKSNHCVRRVIHQ